MWVRPAPCVQPEPFWSILARTVTAHIRGFLDRLLDLHECKH